MMNIEVMQVLVADRQRDLGRSARPGRIARSVRRIRRHDAGHRAIHSTTAVSAATAV